MTLGLVMILVGLALLLADVAPAHYMLPLIGAGVGVLIATFLRRSRAA